MIETACGFPGLLIVAGFAVFRKLAVMLIGMALRAGGGQTEKRAGLVQILGLSDTGIEEQTALVAGPAFAATMRAFKGETGRGMIEILLSLRPVDQFKFAARMFAVTAAALGTLDLAGGMIAAPGSHMGLNDLMTVEAFLVGDFLSQDVALGAVGQPFQTLMEVRQLAGRNLRRGTRRQREQNEKGYMNAGCHGVMSFVFAGTWHAMSILELNSPF